MRGTTGSRMLKFCISEAGSFRLLQTIPWIRHFFVFALPALPKVRHTDSGVELYSFVRYGDVTGKNTYKGRFSDVDRTTLELVNEPFVFHDVAVSSGITSCELFETICLSGKAGSFVVSDKFSEVDVSPGVITRVYDNGGKLLNAYAFGILFDPKLSWFYFISKLLYFPISLITDSGRKHKVSLFIPRLLDYIESGKIRYLPYDVFKTRLKEEFTVIRCMNILIPSYFSEAQIIQGIVNIRESLKEGGILLIGRTTVDNVHLASFFRKERGLLVSFLEINGGTEIRHIIERVNREYEA
jgi:hypothetical protein